jgi:hypothetical protein
VTVDFRITGPDPRGTLRLIAISDRAKARADLIGEPHVGIIVRYFSCVPVCPWVLVYFGPPLYLSSDAALVAFVAGVRAARRALELSEGGIALP